LTNFSPLRWNILNWGKNEEKNTRQNKENFLTQGKKAKKKKTTKKEELLTVWSPMTT